jgi:hypothetical protein
MSRKNVLLPYQVLTAQSLLAPFSSNETYIDWLDNIGITLDVVTADIVGQFFIQGTVNGTSWFDMDVQPTLLVSGANTKMILNLNQVPFHKVRIRFEVTSGTSGTVDAWIMSKML